MAVEISEVLEATHGRLLRGPDQVAFARLYVDSREVEPGGLFAALRGEALDGHDFIQQAIARGATGILCERDPCDTGVVAVIQVQDTKQALLDLTANRLQRLAVPIIAITGSAGKTTTKELIAHVLGRRLRVHKSEGNLNTYTGIPMTVFQMSSSDRVLVVEYGMSHAGEIAELARIGPPDIAVVLNVGLAHVGFLGSIEAVAAAKLELVQGLKPGGLAVLNADDPRVRAMSTASRRHVLFGVSAAAVVRAERIRLHGLEGSQFLLVTPRGSAEVYLRLPGQHSIANALAAAAVALEFDFDASAIAAALHGFTPPARRMNLVAGLQGATIVDDCYNASPGSMEAALQVLRLAPAGTTRVVVMGDMLELGDHAGKAHDDAGATAGKSADWVIALGEHSDRVVKGARKAGLKADRALTADSVERAVELVRPLMSGHTQVLVKGSRGMRMERIVEALRAQP
ncbi:MAG TPA: UDP-N-acetylmuramoyl-tripeptide--D-alanyl-D-alanine ligase [Candidatus Dormibacteraeota bacterium]|nr:UDP-N-acetylmuramoyl-tripeptide--D-alanyl-D-alanine ligase [Candidatus Dormibacteraeota bacterium]